MFDNQGIRASLGFPEVKWLYLTGDVDKSERFSCQIFSEFNVTKIIKIC